MRFGRRWRDLEAELESHQRLAAEAGKRTGAMPDRVREATRDQWAWVWLDDLARDLRFGARGLRRNPGFALVAIATLGLGIAASALMFTLVNSILLRPLPFARAGQLIECANYLPKGALAYLRIHSRAVEWAGMGGEEGLALTGDGEPTMLTGASVSANLLSLLGAVPALGRSFVRGEDQPGRDGEVILSQALWRNRFHADPAILGRALALGGRDRTVVGVMPASFQFPTPETQLWVPLDMDPARFGDYWGGSYMQIIGRRRGASSLEQARSEWQALRPGLVAHWGWPMSADSYSGNTLLPLRSAVVGDIGGTLWLLLGAAGLLLLIACINVANLLLARGRARARETRVRTALGAGRVRLLRQFLAEGGLLAGFGCGLGLVAAWLGLPAFKAILPADLPRLAEVGLDGRVLAASVGLALLSSLVLGLAPAWQRASAKGAKSRFGDGLVLTEVALSVMLVIAAGLALHSLWKLASQNPGFQAAHVLTARVTPSASLCAMPAPCQVFYDRLLEQLRARPGVRAAAAVNSLPLENGAEIFAFFIEGQSPSTGTVRRAAAPPLAWGKIVTPGYLQAMGIPLLRGRAFTPEDAAPGAAPVVLVSQASAARFWPGRDAVGQHLRAGGYKASRTVVGVVGNTREASMASDIADFVSAVIYSPYGPQVIRADNSNQPPQAMTVVVRAAAGSLPSAAEMQAIVSRLQADAVVSAVHPMQDTVAAALAGSRSVSTLFSLLAGLTLLLGAIGVYGVLAYFVAGRTREIGVRMALGAGQSQVLAEVVGRGARLAVVGVAVGLAGALLLTRLMASLLYGVSATDPWTFAAVAALWFAVALLASFIPARRATRVDPARALRAE